jgi:two-component system response regulator YesN
MKILIVEDEFNAREGLAAIIQRMCPQHEICGKASNGEEGLQLALKQEPDLIFVDIELPKMNGLEMIEKLREQHLQSVFVILSGYAEFKYAQKAIQYGVSEYLLKPISYDKLIHVIENIEQLGRSPTKSKKRIIPKNELLKTILSGLNNSRKAIEILGKTLVPKNLYLLNIYFRREYDIKKLQICFQTYSRNQKLENAVIITTFPKNRFMVVLINSKIGKEEMIHTLNFNLISILRQNGFSDSTLSLFPVNSLDALVGKLNSIQQLNEWGLSLGNKQVLLLDKIPKVKWNFKKENNYIRQIDMKALSIVKRGKPEKLKELNRNLLKFLTNEICPPKEFRNICTQYALSILVCYREFNVDTIEKVQEIKLFEAIRNSCTQNEMLDCLDQLILLYHTILPDQTYANSILVKKTIDYIAHYYAEKVSLEEIAKKLKVTPEYISHLFTKNVGISFSDYLKKYRINMAKKIMQTSNFKMYQIGEKIGYKDPKYFNKVFKEVTGMSPKEYMRKG